MESTLKPGDRLHSFIVDAVHPLDEYQAVGIAATHEPSGCSVYHVKNGDSDKLFAFGFKTPPGDSTGVAHILEHTVLCGSRRFPVKDPFLLLLKGSMNTFLNAFTFPDKTLYPASSTVEADLRNLFEVYGDAVFFPLLRPEMFRQEGHRVEFDESGKLVRTGIVYNEMKGNYSTHDSVASDWCMRSLFPGTAYAFDSGGDPAEIPRLDYEAFRRFHASYYHPANTRVFLYGDLDTAAWLELLQTRFLSGFGRGEPARAVLEPAAFAAPVRLTRSYPAQPGDEEDGKASITVNWLLNPVADALETLAMEVLSEILLGTPASPLQRALVDSGLGEDLSAPTGLETELARLTLSAGLRGTAPGREGAIEELVDRTLRACAADGLDPDLVEGALRRFEFRGREIKGGGPFGLRLMRRAFRGWLHGLPPQATLVFAPVMAELRAKLAAEPRWFESLIQSRLLDNRHRSTVTVVPDAGQNQREQAAERKELDDLLAALPEDGRAELRRKAAELAEFQSRPDDPQAVAAIPFLRESDIPAAVRTIPARELAPANAGRVALAHPIHSNGVSYVDFRFDLAGLPIEDLRWASVYAALLPGLGRPGKDYARTANELALATGGFSAFVEASPRARSERGQAPRCRAGLFFRVKCLDGQLEPALALVGDLIRNADFGDAKRLGDQYLELRNEYRSSVVPSGSHFAASRAERGFSTAAALEDLWHGIGQQQFLEELGGALGDGGDGTSLAECAARIGAAFERLRRSLAVRERLTLSVTAGEASLDAAVRAAEAWAAGLPAAGPAALPADGAIDLQPPGQPALEAITLPSKVAFVATALPASLIGQAGYGHELLLGHLLRTGYLWEHVRMKGGAYGASAAGDGMDGIFTFSSYRDPAIVRTLETWRGALAHFAEGGVDANDLLLAKLGCVAKEIRPLSPAESGLVSFRRWLYGIGDDLRQAKRDELLAAEPADLAAAARRLAEALGEAHSVVIADAEMVDKEESVHRLFRPLRLQLSV